MAFFEKKKINPIEIRDQYFIFAGRWYEKFKDERCEGCRLVEDPSIITEEYLQSWSGWKPTQPRRDSYEIPSTRNRSGKFF
jgi:hypothetical protein